MLQTLGRYEVVRPLATGGMATVYLGRVNAAGGFERLVAIKVMHPHIAGDPEFVSMFLDEARLAARIRHQNVVATHDVDQGPEGLFLVMDYVDGPAFHLVVKAVAKQKQALPPEILLRVMSDVLEGLHAAHELTDEDGHPLGLVHRDVSPHNVLVGKDGVARITDFGVAHARTRLTSTQGTSLKGKVAYLSPEQVLVGRVDRRSDVFSAGVVMWEALTRRRLFKGETEGQTLAQIIAGARAAPIDIDPSVPRPISDVCMHALAPNPDDRFQSAIELCDALDAAARSAGIAIAKPRHVAAFLETLQIEDAPVKVPAAPASSGSQSQSQLSAGRVARALLASHPGAEHAPISTNEPSATVGGPQVVPSPAPSARRSRGVWVALAVLGVIGVGAALIVPRVLASAGATASEPPHAAAAAPEATSAAPTRSDPAPSAEPPAAPQPSAVASAAPDEPAPHTEPAPARPLRAAPVAPAPKTPKPSATSYKPSEL